MCGWLQNNKTCLLVRAGVKGSIRPCASQTPRARCPKRDNEPGGGFVWDIPSQLGRISSKLGKTLETSAVGEGIAIDNVGIEMVI